MSSGDLSLPRVLCLHAQQPPVPAKTHLLVCDHSAISATATNLRQKSYLALPNGLERELGPDEAEVIFGEERGVGVVELAVERGISSNLRLVICGVGGLEVLAVMWELESELAHSNQTVQRT